MPQQILLLSCYELGHQPLSLAWPLAFLREAGCQVTARDLAVESFSDDEVARATFVGIAAPMHTALRLGAQAAARVRALNPRAHICFYGLYAWLNKDYLLDHLADTVLAGEHEKTLVDLIQALDRRDEPGAVTGVSTRTSPTRPGLTRLTFPIPDRTGLPPLDRYARYLQNGESALAGYVEASRGCLHTCRHCPVVPIYNGRFFVVPARTVLADIRQQVAAGARHITFGDPDFLNGPSHALQIARALHVEFPTLTFDFTTKVEHILKHRALFAEFAALGCAFIISAIESVSDVVLARLHKGHTAADVEAALAILEGAGIALQPTLVAFTPWTTLEDYIAQLDFIRIHDLSQHIPPIQLAIRLLVPPGSALLNAPDAHEWAGELDPASFTYRWRHPDPRLDRLYEEVSARVALADSQGEPPLETFAAICRAAYAMARRPLPAQSAISSRPAPPRLTENWFC